MAQAPRDPPEFPTEWENLSDNQRDIFVKSITRMRMWRFFCFAIGSILLALQPLFNDFLNSREKERDYELSKIEKQSSSDANLNNVVLTNLLNLSQELISLKVENEALKKRIQELSTKP